MLQLTEFGLGCTRYERRLLKSMSCTNLTLTAGDVLYLPRGMVHVASTSTSTSIHMTYQLQTKGHTWAELRYGNVPVDVSAFWLLNLGQPSSTSSSRTLPDSYLERTVSKLSCLNGCHSFTLKRKIEAGEDLE